MSQLQTQTYYDKFSLNYEDRRHAGYHAFLDDLESSIVARFGKNLKVLEVGCGTGLILDRLRPVTSQSAGIDLSFGMLGKSAERGLKVLQASATQLPFADNSFDVAYSFKVLAHVPDIKLAMSEMARVTKPGGYVIAEFYNKTSIRYLRWLLRKNRGKRLKTGIFEGDIFTRYDKTGEMESYMPVSMTKKAVKGVMVWSPGAFVYDIPVIRSLFKFLEKFMTFGFLNYFGGFQVLIYQKKS